MSTRSTDPPPMQPDLAIVNARVLDGTGGPARWGSVAIAGARILAVGPDVEGKARLKYEVRVDEAGAPLLWITTLKPV